jgi:hypothetical protein
VDAAKASLCDVSGSRHFRPCDGLKLVVEPPVGPVLTDCGWCLDAGWSRQCELRVTDGAWLADLGFADLHCVCGE